MADADHTALRRKAILESAVGLFDSHGYAVTTMDEIAAGAGISKGSIYNYFQSKSDLFSRLFAEEITLDEASVEEMFGRQVPATEKIAAYVDFWHHRLEHYLRVGRLTLEFWATAARGQDGGSLAGMLQEAQDRWLDRLSQVIAQGIADGELQTPLDASAAAEFIHGVMDGLLVHMIVGVAGEAGEDTRRSLKRFVLAALGGPEPNGPNGGSED